MVCFVWKKSLNEVSPLCPRCNELESITHLLFSCPYATKVWDLAPLATTIRAIDVVTTLEGWEKARKLPPLPPVRLEVGTLSASIVWNLWISRNQLIFAKWSFTPEETLHKAISEAREWKLAQPSPKTTTTIPLITIEPDPRRSGLTSVHTDVAWNWATRSAGFGWIIDDMVSSSHHSATDLYVSSPLMAEALAVRSAINFALAGGIEAISIRSDSQGLINIINRQEMKSELFGILRDIYGISTLFFLHLSLLNLALLQDQPMYRLILLLNRPYGL